MEKLADEKQKMEERLHHVEEEQRKQQQEFVEEATKQSSVSSCLFTHAGSGTQPSCWRQGLKE